MENLKLAGISNAVADFAGSLDNIDEMLIVELVLSAGVFKVFKSHVIARHDHFLADSFAGEAVGEMLELKINELAGLHDGIIQRWDGRSGEDDSHDALEILLGIVAELGDLFIGIDFG